MRTSTAYFAGAGTVVAAIAVGISGGLLMGDAMSPKSVKHGTEMTRLQRRMSPEPVAVSIAPSQPVQYLAASQFTASVAPAALVPAPSPAAAAQPVAHEQVVASEEDAAARARDVDMRRAMEKRRADRRQHWAEKQRQKQLQEQRAAEDENAQPGARDETEPRQELVAQPVRVEMPPFRLFGSD